MLKFYAQRSLEWFKVLIGLWSRQYHDSRIILEQQGELKYIVITAKFQRNSARALLVVLSVLAGLLVLMTAVSAYLHGAKLMLERSHREIYIAMRSAGMDPEAANGEYSQEEMLEMARAIRERDIQIRQYVGDWTESLIRKNGELRSLIRSSGLNEKVISIIQGSTPIGGNSESFSNNPLLSGAFAKEASTNRELRSLLEALPSRMPLEDHAITSDFGIRVHPTLKRPALHAGIDLIPTTNNDYVLSVKPGKVIVARFHGNMGNTVIVRHQRGVETLYGHLDKILVKEGQDVLETTVLGTVGNTGQSTGKHLHFEVFVGSYQVDPRKVIQTAQNVHKI